MGPGRESLSAEEAALDAALEALRRCCARAPKPQRLRNRLDFRQESEEARLLGHPLDVLNEADLRDYLGEAGNTLDPAELAYFLPRIAEFLAEGRCLNGAGWFASCNFLRMSGFPERWPDDRAAAMQGFVAAFVAVVGAHPERYAEASDLHLGEALIMAANAGVALEGVLRALDACAPQRLARAITIWTEAEVQAWALMDRDGMLAQIVQSELWETIAAQTVTQAWLESKRPWDMLAAEAEREQDPEWRERLKRAASLWTTGPAATA
ncbi:MAG: hypothetical protein AAFV49_11425 [Pseudomonadota bacterium]